LLIAELAAVFVFVLDVDEELGESAFNGGVSVFADGV
jgi:hypothetical protein